MAKLIFALAVLLAVVATFTVSAQGGVKDVLGNYYDFTTGQVSSSLTGHVYNTAPAVVPVHSYVAHGGYAAAPVVAGGVYGGAGVYGAGLYGAGLYGAPLLYK
ncbi:hypothetical protein TYRP_012673 [Tyrophagus putrescentiae]|nr:hypothetical protein TYRP_012673 [Tyrophagus putrescentiae]